MHSFLRITLVMSGICMLLAACGSSVVRPAPIAHLGLDIRDITAAPYVIGAGDEIEIKFFFTPELNEVVQVRPDGKISMMFAQDIKAAGKTPEQLARYITRKLAPHIKQSDLVVIMHGFGSQKAYVGGEVAKPGAVQLLGRETVLQVLSEAGWTTPAAHRDEIVLVRRAEEGEEEVYILNIGKMMTGEDMTQNVIVQAGDLILVPPSGAVVFDRWVDRNIRQAIPLPTEFIVNRGVGPR